MDKRDVNWLAGLIDGEGHFGIYANNTRKDGGKTYRAEFSMKLRADDRMVLLFCQELTGLGKIYNVSGQGKNGKPQVMWKVVKREELLKFAKMLDTVSLRTKKAREYVFWRRAVLEIQKEATPKRSEAMLYCKEQMQALRRYDSATED